MSNFGSKSKGPLNNIETWTNLAALGILVITTFVDICIQLGTEYSELHSSILSESEESRKLTAEVLKILDDGRNWGPQFVIARSVTCFPSGSLGVIMATFISVNQWFTITKFKWLAEGNDICWYSLRIPNFWIQRLEEWEESPLSVQVRGRKRKKFAQRAKILVLNICIAVQKGIIVVSKSLQTSSILCASFVLSFLNCCKRQLNPSSAASNNQNGSVPESRSDPDLGPYILLLEDEPKLPNRVLDKISSGVNQFILTGKRKQPKSLAQLLMKSTGLKGLIEFDKDQILNLNAKEPPNSWTLPLITLTSTAIALPNNEADLAAELQRSVREGLLYAGKSPGTPEKLTNFRNAADAVWVGVELHFKGLNVDLLQATNDSKKS
ncbi:uncharacterized protein [Coffea arabica]|uniref:Uncharacterized protein isoform X2 n=1 Tax=Coffea arabica TaxID=13443 RepID=A0ABM4VJV2_COFAR